MLVIRFTKIGRKNDPKFRLIVKEKRSKRDGEYVHLIGFYDPVANPHIFRYDQVKLDHWLSRGAVLSEGVAKLIKLPPKAKKAKKVVKAKSDESVTTKKPAGAVKKVAPERKQQLKRETKTYQ